MPLVCHRFGQTAWVEWESIHTSMWPNRTKPFDQRCSK